MANAFDLKDLPGQVTTMVDTQALLTWLRFGTTDPPIPTATPLRHLSKQGRRKAPQSQPFPVVKSSPSHEDSSYSDKE
jgi:hypothetical protein